MIPLARAGVDRGWDVVWATGADVCSYIGAAGLTVLEAGLSMAERRKRRVAYLAGREIPPRQLADYTFPFFAAVAAPPMLADLLSFTAEWVPDLVIHEAAEFAGAVTAAVRGAPSVTHGYGPLTPAHRVARAGQEAAPMWASVGLEAPPYGGSYEWLYLDIYPSSLQPTDTSHVPSRLPLRPVAFDNPTEHGDQTDRPEPGERDHLVYLTFGTTANDPSRLRTALEAISALEVKVLVTVGPDGDPVAMGTQPDRVQVERFIPQAEVLPGCNVVVSHGGSGTVLGAASWAVPQLCLPRAADQFLNADAVARSGVGQALDPEAVSGHAIRDEVQRLLVDPSFKLNARRVAAELAEMPSPPDVLDSLENLIS